MKSGAYIAFLLLLSRMLPASTLELAAFCRTTHDTAFILRETEENVSSGWLKLGDTYSGYTLVEFYAEERALRLRHSESDDWKTIGLANSAMRAARVQFTVTSVGLIHRPDGAIPVALLCRHLAEIARHTDNITIDMHHGNGPAERQAMRMMLSALPTIGFSSFTVNFRMAPALEPVVMSFLCHISEPPYSYYLIERHNDGWGPTWLTMGDALADLRLGSFDDIRDSVLLTGANQTFELPLNRPTLLRPNGTASAVPLLVAGNGDILYEGRRIDADELRHLLGSGAAFDRDMYCVVYLSGRETVQRADSLGIIYEACYYAGFNQDPFIVPSLLPLPL